TIILGGIPRPTAKKAEWSCSLDPMVGNARPAAVTSHD
ncbi:hypothetical protein AVEN_142679-1, partial [Araneus ventricosus]